MRLMSILTLCIACGPVSQSDFNDAGDDVFNPEDGGSSSDDTAEPPSPVDEDGDGFADGVDCDDTDPEVGLATTWYRDADQDGFGDPEDLIVLCDQPDGFVEDNTDCDDAFATIYPGAPEYCDLIDQDCDGEADNGHLWYLDHDGDGYGDPDFLYEDGCDGSTYLVNNGEDCDDSNADVSPVAQEVCDGIDNDCEGSIDEGASDAVTWYDDSDGDGYGVADDSVEACDQPSGYADNALDCDDHDDDVNPDGVEVCNEEDDNCDGDVDEGVTITVYPDADGDGYGDESAPIEACEESAGWVEDSSDCDDSEALSNPGGTEVCGDAIDNDCSGDADGSDSSDAPTWYLDADADGEGDSASSDVACDAPSGYVSDASDCDDSDSTINTSATEVCDSVDNDCDGTTDEDDASDASDWYLDSDEDGYGDENGTAVTQCDQPDGYIDNASDCDDVDEDVNPGQTEVCDDDDTDEDCSGDSDDDDSGVDTSTMTTSYADADGDGYGDSSVSETACEVDSSYTEDDTDCDDTDSSVNPGAEEYCDEADNDCDGVIDEDVELTWYADSDEDGYGNSGSTTEACAAPSGYVEDDTDCDDSDSAVSPSASEVCDFVDNDCDGDIDDDDSSTDTTTMSAWYADGDSDGFGDASDELDACDQPSGYIEDDTDCDDTDSEIYPEADEYCDEVDNDCDGETDEDDAVDAATWYLDEDEDGFGDASSTDVACQAPEGYVDDDTDCDDNSDSVNPDATEFCDTIDNDCDGDTDEDVSTTFYVDEDGDGYGDSSASTEDCLEPSGYTTNATDCDDTDELVNPGAEESIDAETCEDEVDNDCDGDTDEDDSSCECVDSDTADTADPCDEGDTADIAGADTASPVDTSTPGLDTATP
jgi:large repetitive protein